jgi:3-hydroxyacyl-[acyl-carrier-protein] dehydratase
MLEAHELLKLLPHRYPLLLLDRVTDIEEGVSGTGIKNVTVNESYFQGHFPDNPVMPGVFIIECVAQTAAVVFSYRRDAEGEGEAGAGGEAAPRQRYLATIQDFKFRRPVTPGDQLIIKVKLLRRFGNLLQISAEVYREQEVVARGRLTFAG